LASIANVDWRELTHHELMQISKNVRQEQWDHTAWICYQIANRLDAKGLPFHAYHPHRESPKVEHNPTFVFEALKRKREKRKGINASRD
jgi:hypothetical protein